MRLLAPFFPVCILILLFSSLPAYPQNSKVAFSVKGIERKMAKINDNLYADRFEITNGEYNIFLKDILIKDSFQYIDYQSDSTGWDMVSIACEPLTALWYHRHPAFANYPVVNISHEAAMAYCKWLTEKYNSFPARKFRKVIFYLPSSDEWLAAAQGYKRDRIYPWGDYLVNKKGIYLCNFKPVGDPYLVRDSSGAPMIVGYTGQHIWQAARFPDEKSFYTMKVKSFEPNDFGLYNISGNVAEMIEKPGVAMGGSWNSYGGEVTVTSSKEYKYPSPEVGFRVFMKILE